MKTFENVQALTESRLTAGQIVETKGYYTAGDGGGGRYLIEDSATVDEQGSGFTIANGKFAVLQAKVVNVRQFGAVGDDTTDDTISIQAAIDAASSETGGVKPVGVYFPAGEYRLNTFTSFTSTGVAEDRRFCVTVPANLKLFGEGEITYSIDQAVIGYFVHILALKGSNITIDGLTFQNKDASATQFGSIAIAMNTKHDDDIRTGTYENVFIRNCRFYNNIFSTQIYFRDWGDSNFRKHVVESCYCEPGGGVGTGGDTGAFDSHGNEGIRCQDVQYLNNTVLGGTNASALNAVGVQRIVIAGNYVKDNWYAACQMENNTTDVSITGNTFIATDANAVYGVCTWLDDCQNITVSGNSFFGNSDNKRGVWITYQGYSESDDGVSTDYGSYLTSGININGNNLNNCGIVSGAFGTPVGAGGGLGKISIGQNTINQNGVSVDKGISIGDCETLNIQGNTVIGATARSIEVVMANNQETIIQGNITSKAAAESSFGLYMTGGAGDIRIVANNIFMNDIELWEGYRVNNFNGGTIATTGDSNTFEPHFIKDGVMQIIGAGSPETSVAAPVGSIFQRKDGGVGNSFYVKEAGTGNTGWASK